MRAILAATIFCVLTWTAPALTAFAEGSLTALVSIDGLVAAGQRAGMAITDDPSILFVN